MPEPSPPGAEGPPRTTKENGAVIGVDPLFWTCCRLAVAEILRLRLHPAIPDIYLLRSHPVRKVELTGIVVAKEESSLMISYAVNDGTGTISCVYWFPSEERFVATRQTMPLGQLVSVSGRVTEFRAKRQVTVDVIIAETDPNVETVRWLEVAELMESVYIQPAQDTGVNMKDLEAWLEVHEGATNDASDTNGEISSEVIFILIERAISSPLLAKQSEQYEQLSTKTVLDNPTEEDLLRLVKLHIEAHNLERFPFGLLLNAPGIDSLIRTIFALQHGNDFPSKQRCTSMLSRAMQSLVKGGLIYHIGGDEDAYEVISHQLNLGPAVFDLIKERCQNGPDAVSGEYIVHTIRNMSQFKSITKAKIEKSIELLIASSDIYECGAQQYKSL
ncbi:CST complex subunit STN1 [Geranomyces variabilis]|nr:CST complex subunit STN1 [Geranomyces variabilis]